MPVTRARKVRLSDLGEFGFIERIKRRVGRTSAICGIGDDAAVLPLPSKKCLLVTTDMFIEGVHFTKLSPPIDVGHKAMAANISDIAAMGGTPKYAVVSLGVPASCSWQFAAALYRGMTKTAKKFHVDIVGGDTVHSGKITINITLTGEAQKNRVIYRAGARPGDHIFVTGPLGNSLKSGRHLKFVPRLREAQFLLKKFMPSSMIDISDGLAQDLGHILKASRVGAMIDEERIPCRPGAGVNNALYDGEDFEFLFTLSPVRARALQKIKDKRVSFYCIGEIVPGRPQMSLKTAGGLLKKISAHGYRHF